MQDLPVKETFPAATNGEKPRNALHRRPVAANTRVNNPQHRFDPRESDNSTEPVELKHQSVQENTRNILKYGVNGMSLPQVFQFVCGEMQDAFTQAARCFRRRDPHFASSLNGRRAPGFT